MRLTALCYCTFMVMITWVMKSLFIRFHKNIQKNSIFCNFHYRSSPNTFYVTCERGYRKNSRKYNNIDFAS